MAYKIMLVLSLAAAALVVMTSAQPTNHVVSKRAVLLDDNFATEKQLVPRRVPRSPGPQYDEVPLVPESKDAFYHPPGKVGPVYTFVKTDYHGNVKWGVRHKVGEQYGR